MSNLDSNPISKTRGKRNFSNSSFPHSTQPLKKPSANPLYSISLERQYSTEIAFQKAEQNIKKLAQRAAETALSVIIRTVQRELQVRLFFLFLNLYFSIFTYYISLNLYKYLIIFFILVLSIWL